MTQSTPTGVSGNPTDQIARDLGLNNPEAQAAAVARVNHLEARRKAKEDKIVRDIAKKSRNDAKETRRRAGEVGVEDDEIVSDVEEDDEPDKEPSRTNTPEPKSWEEMLARASPTSLKSLHMIAGFVRSTIPENAGKLVSAASAQISKIRTKISAAAEEDYSSVPNQKYPVSPIVWNLFDRGQYIPLTLFTSKSMKRLHQDPSSCVTKNVSIPNEGNKIPVLSVAPFGEEKDMSIPDWHEAKANYRIFLLEAFDDEVAGRWIRHHEFLASIDDFEKSFPAIVRFDISERIHYTFRPMKFNEIAYYQKWNATKLEILQENLELGMKNLSSSSSNASSGPFRAQHGSVTRSKPYERQPFPEGRGSSTGSNVCLICARPGHRANNCTKSMLEKGGDTTCAWREGKLTGISSKRAICVGWNLSGKCVGKHNDTILHSCSFCGKSDHHAFSHSCN
jgi:hypothetical protein